MGDNEDDNTSSPSTTSSSESASLPVDKLSKDSEDGSTTSKSLMGDQIDIEDDFVKLLELDYSNSKDHDKATDLPKMATEQLASPEAQLPNISGLKLTPLQEGALPTYTQFPISNEAAALLCEIRGLPPPELDSTWTVQTQADIDEENIKRRRLLGATAPKAKFSVYGRELKSTDNADAFLAPSVPSILLLLLRHPPSRHSSKITTFRRSS
ncbi:uncharacterized protein LOC107045871 [Diachasma alloeum]|uniref:uncharacterized protein LOC107045871 n=1 Tax=Diachasma alloeum TaxID=454923 RepID=UPI0007384C3F|nr:uncharacterized protein LOC107045871 [Diachasma alloeum]